MVFAMGARRFVASRGLFNQVYLWKYLLCEANTTFFIGYDCITQMIAKNKNMTAFWRISNYAAAMQFSVNC